MPLPTQFGVLPPHAVQLPGVPQEADVPAQLATHTLPTQFGVLPLHAVQLPETPQEAAVPAQLAEHAPATQEPLEQTLPQLPQLFLSVVVLTHVPLHNVSLPGQPHVPGVPAVLLLQTCPLGHPP